MIKRIAGSVLLTGILSTNVLAYDTAQAETFNKAFSHVTQANAAKSKLMVEGNEALKMLRDKKKFIFLDIRTPGEMAVLGLKTDNTLEIPLEHLFEKKNLDRLPTDRPIIIVCHSGSRAKMAVMNLKMIGFKNTRVLKSGMVGLAISDNPKNAPLK